MIISLHSVVSSTIDKYRIQDGVAKPGANQDFELENPFSGNTILMATMADIQND